MKKTEDQRRIESSQRDYWSSESKWEREGEPGSNATFHILFVLGIVVVMLILLAFGVQFD